MKAIKFILPALATVAMAACTQDLNPQVPAENNDITCVVEATVDKGVDTKLTFVDDGTTKVDLKWNATGEAFSAFVGTDAASEVRKFDQISASSDCETATFRGNLPAGTEKFYAFYPAQDLTAGAYNSVIADFSNQKGNEIDLRNMYMRASVDLNGSASFKHLTSVLAITLDFGAGINGKATDVTIEGWEIINKVAYNLTSGSLNKLYPAPGSYVHGTIRFTEELDVVDGKATLYYHFPSPNALGNPTIEARIGDDTYKFTLPNRSGANNKATVPGKIYNVIANQGEKVNIPLLRGDYEFLKEIVHDRLYETCPYDYHYPNWPAWNTKEKLQSLFPGITFGGNAETGFYVKEIGNFKVTAWPEKIHLVNLEIIKMRETTTFSGSELPKDWYTPNLTKLEIYGAGLTGVIPASLASSTPKLEEITLDKNDLYGALPHDWASEKLQTIILNSGNTGLGYLVPADFDVLLNSQKTIGDKTSFKPGGTNETYIGFEKGWGQVRYEKFDPEAVIGATDVWSEYRKLLGEDKTNDAIDSWAWYYWDAGHVPQKMLDWDQAAADAYTAQCRAERGL